MKREFAALSLLIVNLAGLACVIHGFSVPPTSLSHISAHGRTQVRTGQLMHRCRCKKLKEERRHNPAQLVNSSGRGSWVCPEASTDRDTLLCLFTATRGFIQGCMRVTMREHTYRMQSGQKALDIGQMFPELLKL
ncbi:hypothetical protein WJX79_008743 [Trebouxia sp. C0005]